MKPKSTYPISVYQKAHAEYPKAVARKGLYCVAFFGHSRPKNLKHKETCESIWRGLIRKHLQSIQLISH